jgi:hypothetical protein
MHTSTSKTNPLSALLFFLALTMDFIIFAFDLFIVLVLIFVFFSLVKR